MAKSAKNYYEILGVTPDVETVELKKVYRRLVRKFHPDINPNGELRFKDIMEAYETLSDDKLRSRYDTINGFFKKAKPTENTEYVVRKNAQKNDEFERSKTASAKQDSVKTEEKKEKEPVKEKPKATQTRSDDAIWVEIINDLIDGFSQISKRKPTNAPKPIKGDDIYTDVVISLRESISGVHKVINVVHTESCPRCRGHKFMNDTNCSNCGGKGEVTTHQKIDVKIPENIKDGAKLRLAGEGKKGLYGGKNGDLFLKISVTPDSTFKVDGADLLCEVPISPFEAVLGGDIKIPAINGEVTLNVPKNTKSGQVFRISSKGLKKNGLVGDIIVTVKIQIPDKISDEEIILYEKLRDCSGSSLRKNV